MKQGIHYKNYKLIKLEHSNSRLIHDGKFSSMNSNFSNIKLRKDNQINQKHKKKLPYAVSYEKNKQRFLKNSQMLTKVTPRIQSRENTSKKAEHY